MAVVYVRDYGSQHFNKLLKACHILFTFCAFVYFII